MQFFWTIKVRKAKDLYLEESNEWGSDYNPYCHVQIWWQKFCIVIFMAFLQYHCFIVSCYIFIVNHIYGRFWCVLESQTRNIEINIYVRICFPSAMWLLVFVKKLNRRLFQDSHLVFIFVVFLLVVSWCCCVVTNFRAQKLMIFLKCFKWLKNWVLDVLKSTIRI